MTFIKIDADTVLNADAIDRINFNHVRPNTQDRCIRIELRAIPGLAESRIVLLRYRAELAAALLETLNPKPIQPPGSIPAVPFLITLFNEEWENPVENYAVCRIPCVGEYLVLWDAETSVSAAFQVDKVCHEIPVATSNHDPLRPAQLGRGKPEVILVVSPCNAPLSIYEFLPLEATS